MSLWRMSLGKGDCSQPTFRCAAIQDLLGSELTEGETVKQGSLLNKRTHKPQATPLHGPQHSQGEAHNMA